MLKEKKVIGRKWDSMIRKSVSRLQKDSWRGMSNGRRKKKKKKETGGGGLFFVEEGGSPKE